MLAEWIGGPLDGQVAHVEHPHLGYAVAYDANHQPVDNYPGLQNYLTDIDFYDDIGHSLGVVEVVLYDVINRRIMFSEKLTTLREAGN